ncbi:IPExxxVDY family protein [Pontimicrobium aquaticum]|uniref:IPExxxVDY family protein n=1 Tax=Pontimicrobium aquaticum TaxID=2565367 RepID=A0A4U0F175_9FLAO|nr:IPExxxVDY family protein [Pontimicrobium aquaticum]TJY38185.1 IPExxxVDY family protein [Pontimicrobium aquaticum]
MALHKLLVDDFDIETYSLLAIHCTLEDYRIAYLLNKQLQISLQRKQQDIDVQYTASSFPIYEWKDKNQQTIWNLVSNVCKKEEDSMASSGSLFETQNKILRTHNLIPEYKKVNYLLKINNDGNFINERAIIHKIQEMPQVAAVFSINVSQLKSKDNLIFN